MPETTIVTQLTALYAALVSTGVAVWTVYKDLNDKGRLRVQCGFRELITPHHGVEHDVLTFTVTNIGKRPVMVTNIGGMITKETGFIVTDDHIPKMLSPGEYFVAMGKEHTTIWNGVRLLCAYDSVGNTYKASKNDVAEVNKKLADLKARGIKASHFEPMRR